MVFHWSLSDRMSPQVSRTRLRILAVLSKAIIWIVFTRPSTSKSSRPFNNPLLIVPNAPITIGTIVTSMFHSFFNSLARSRYLSFFSRSFRLVVSFLSPHSLHLLFCCVLSILALIWLVLMVLSCAVIKRDSVSLLRFPFLTQVQVFWCEMLFTRRLKRP